MCLHKMAHARTHVHVGHIACFQPHRGDTHGAMKKNLNQFGGQNPEKFNFENLCNIPQKNPKKSWTDRLTDTSPIEATGPLWAYALASCISLSSSVTSIPDPSVLVTQLGQQ